MGRDGKQRDAISGRKWWDEAAERKKHTQNKAANTVYFICEGEGKKTHWYTNKYLRRLDKLLSRKHIKKKQETVLFNTDNQTEYKWGVGGALWWMIIITAVAFMCSQKTGNPLTSPSYLDSQLVWKIVTTCYGPKPFLTPANAIETWLSRVPLKKTHAHTSRFTELEGGNRMFTSACLDIK